MSDDDDRSRKRRKTKRGRGHGRLGEEPKVGKDARRPDAPMPRPSKPTEGADDAASTRGCDPFDAEMSWAREHVDLDEFELRLKAALLIRRHGEWIRCMGERKVTAVGGRYAITVDVPTRTLIVSMRPLPCRDAVLRTSLAAIPGAPCDLAEFHIEAVEDGVSILARIDLEGRRLHREEFQWLRSEIELRAARISRSAEEGSDACAEGGDA